MRGVLIGGVLGVKDGSEVLPGVLPGIFQGCYRHRAAFAAGGDQKALDEAEGRRRHSVKPLRRRRKPSKNQLDLLRSLQAQFPEVARQLQPAIDQGGFQKCLLCGDPVAYLGHFLPDDHRRYGAPAGKWRTWFYGLCEVCFSTPGAQERVEAEILAEVRTQTARFN